MIFLFQVHPTSISVDGILGNLRLCDMSLGQDHCWGWLCDIRNQGIESLIKVPHLSIVPFALFKIIVSLFVHVNLAFVL